MGNIFEGQTVCCIASGPSLTQEDCDFIARTGIPTIAVNSSWEIARFCDIVYGGDCAWWDENFSKIDIDAALWTYSENGANKHKINRHVPRSAGAWNSGMRAIQLAIEKGAKRIILLGYDASIANGTHFHGDHEKLKNPTQVNCERWKKQFANLNIFDCEIINSSRYTELDCFKTMKLEDALIC